jgi:hypothetical protein
MKTPKISVTPTGKIEHQVQVQRGRKVIMDRTVFLNREELDAFIKGCKLIEDILERSKGK